MGRHFAYGEKILQKIYKILAHMLYSQCKLESGATSNFVDTSNSSVETEPAVEVEPQEIKRDPFLPETLGPEYAPDEILVKFKPGISPARMAEMHRAFGTVKIREIESIGVYLLRIPSGKTAAEMVREYQPPFFFSHSNVYLFYRSLHFMDKYAKAS